MTGTRHGARYSRGGRGFFPFSEASAARIVETKCGQGSQDAEAHKLYAS